MTDRRVVAGTLMALLLAGCSQTETPGVPAPEPESQPSPLVDVPGQPTAPGHTLAVEATPPTTAREAAARLAAVEWLVCGS